MIKGKEDIFNFLGRAIFIVFFFILMSSISDMLGKPTKVVSQQKPFSELQAGSVKAIITDAIQFPSLEKSILQLKVRVDFPQTLEKLKIAADTRKISQTFIFLHKSELSKNPQTFCRFYYHLFSNGSKELPILS